MIELPDDFRDLLIELHDAGAEFVVLGGHAVAFHGHPRATKEMDLLVRARPENAKRIYHALAEFGARLESFEVLESDFASYDGVLQIGLPSRRIDILNRATGITFDEAIADGADWPCETRPLADSPLRSGFARQTPFQHQSAQFSDSTSSPALSMSIKCLVSRTPVIQATGV